MKFLHKTAFSIWIAAFSLFVARGQVALSEEQAIEMLLQNHPAMQAAALGLQQQAALAGAAKVWEPAEVYHNIAADPDYGMFGAANFGINQAFPSRKMTRANRLFYERQKVLAQAGVQLTRQQLVKSVKELYQHLSFIQSEAALYQRLDSLYQIVSAVADSRFRAGEIAQMEQLAIRDKAAQVRMALETTGHEIEFDRVVLGQLLGLPGPVSPLMEPFQRMSFSLSDTALVENSAQSALSRSAVQVAESQLAQTQAKRAPSFAGGLIAQYLPPTGEIYPGWQLGMRLPIAAKSLKAEQEAATVGIMAANAGYRAELLRQRNEMAHLLHEQEKYEIRLNYYEQQGKALAEELLRAALINYRTGEIGFIELTQLAEQASAIELDYLENLFGLNMTVLELRALTGQLNH